MNEDKSNIPDSLRQKFPDLQPVKRKPVLATVNGIGFSMFGGRDRDPETLTYVKTHCFCFIFIPLIAIGAYRVADAERGWYFLGKVRLSSFAKSWNIGFFGLTLLFAAILAEHSYKSSPDYRAKQDLKRAAEELTLGRPLEAARLYRNVAEGQAHAEEGKKGLHEALEKSLNSDSPQTVAAGFRLLAGLPQRYKSPMPIVPEAQARGMALIEKFRAKDPEGALEILHPVAALAGGTNNASRPLEIELLKETIAAKPGNINRVVELALIYEEQEQQKLAAERAEMASGKPGASTKSGEKETGEASTGESVKPTAAAVPENIKLLKPYHDKLGASEGARMLGEHLIKESNYEEAYALLYPYVQTNLDRLRALDREYTNAIGAAYHNAFEQLKHHGADPSFYANYEKASKPERENMVEAFVAKYMQTDAGFLRAERALRAGSKIVNVTLDLGIVQLTRAQRLSDPAARKQELEAAEKTLLSIQGVAGSSDAYRMHLGQVYYWLGKPKEGKQLFDQLLAAHHRDVQVLMAIAETLREVGEDAEARRVLEEAYKGAKSDEERFAAAGVRARTFQDTDDEIAWLKKCDPAAPSVQIDLNSAQGSKALQEQNRELAAQFFRKAAAGYDGLPRNAVTLNNCGLVYLDLFHTTGSVEDYNRGLAMFEQAVALAPGDSVLLNNFTHLLVTRAYMDAVGDAIHYEALKDTPDSAMLRNLYQDEAGWEQVRGRLQRSEYMKKTLNYLDKALLLMPKNRSLYQFSLHLHSTSRDLAELQKLQQRLETASPDLTGVLGETKEMYAADKQKEQLARVQKDFQRYAQLVETAPIREHAVTLAVAENKMNELALYCSTFAGEAKAEEILAKARATYQRQPSAASRWELLSALFLCAHEDLKMGNADYARQAEVTRRAVWPVNPITFVAEQNAGVAAMVRTNAHVLEAVELLREEIRLMPKHRTVWEWSLFHTLDPKIASEILAQLKQDEAGRLVDELQFRLNPAAASYILEQYWTKRMNGDEAAAKQIYEQGIKEGVPLPALAAAGG